MLNSVQLMGRLTADPELRYTQGEGVAITSFTLASDTGRKTKDGDKITHFIDCVAWRNQAEFACKYLSKGRLIVVEGELSTRSYTDRNEARRKVTEITVSRFHFADSRKPGQDQRGQQGGDFTPYEGDLPEGFEEMDDDGDLPF